jgi:hypothetical protein
MNDMDKLTLELFTNKNQYKKYLSKIEPTNDVKIFREKCLEYKDEIMKRVEMLLLDNDNDIDNHFIYDSFGIFARELIKDIEKKSEKKENEVESDTEEDYNEDEDEMLFPPDKMVEPVEKYSFWGKERVIQQNAFVSHYPTNTSVRRRFVRRNSILPKDS